MRTKAELADEINQRTGVPKRDVLNTLESLADVAHAQLAIGQDVKLPGIGLLMPSVQAPRRGITPSTKEPFETREKRVVRFRPTRELKEAVAR